MKKEDSVIRISKENHLRMKRVMSSIKELEGKKPTTNELMERTLDALDAIEKGKMVYLVGEKIFYHLSDARGEACMEAVRLKDIPMPPQIAIIIGEDNGT